MKFSSIIAFAALISASAAGPALASPITPDGPFTAEGTTSLTIGTATLTCHAKLTGTVSGGVGTVNTAVFSTGLCPLATKAGTWTVTSTSPTSIQISGIAVNTPIGNCTAGTVTGAYNNTTFTLTFTNQPIPPNCKVSASLVTSNNALTAH